jgi:hypothetical protein
MADSPDTSALRRRFERRANWLTGAATIFLVMIVVLLGFGGVVVYQAPALTSKDIAQSYDDRIAATLKEIQKVQARDDDIIKWATPEFKACTPAFKEALKEWSPPAAGDRPDDNAFHPVSFQDHIPSLDEVRSELIKTLDSPELSSQKKIGVQLVIANCAADIFFIMSPQGYNVMEAAIAGRDLPFDREALNTIWDEHKKLTDQNQFLQGVINQIREYQIEQRAKGSSDGTESADTNVIVWQRLIQTSVTRFGILAVIGFFVSLLVSLYRYNVRLAAFYRARADGLLFLQNGVVGGSNTVRNFETLERVLTPQLDFGRTPATPLSQLIDLVRAVRGTDKAEE